MTAESWIVLLVTCFVCVSSHDEQFDYEEPCEGGLNKTQQVGGQLGSRILLPCRFSTSSNNSVTWSHVYVRDVVQFSARRIWFTDHRYGRVKVFPNQISEGNYSICIDDLAESDVGDYRCRQGDFCHQVEVSIEKRSWDTETIELMLICVGVTLFILVLVGAYCWYYETCFGFFNNRGDYRNEPVITVATAMDNNFFVYENDDQCPASADQTRNHSVPPEALRDPAGQPPGHSSTGIYPNLNQLKFQRVESQRTQKRFHTDLITRLREASVRRHYYVNQVELNRQQAAAAQAETHHRDDVGKKDNKDKCEYTNPIYNRSTDRQGRL